VTAVKILQQLPQLFRYADVEKFTGNANVFLMRALKSGLVDRIARGVYVNAFLKNRPEIEEVACYLRKAIPFRDELDLALLDRRRLNLLANNFPGPTRKLVQELISPAKHVGGVQE
jgi:hypothetical protein